MKNLHLEPTIEKKIINFFDLYKHIECKVWIIILKQKANINFNQTLFW